MTPPFGKKSRKIDKTFSEEMFESWLKMKNNISGGYRHNKSKKEKTIYSLTDKLWGDKPPTSSLFLYDLSF